MLFLIYIIEVKCRYNHTLAIGSGSAAFASAVRLKWEGTNDLLIMTDDLLGGTSRNTGSDKQTYYKLSDSTKKPDSPYKMAEAISGRGVMHGDIALVESICLINAFYHLVGVGVPFPHNDYGRYKSLISTNV